MSLGMVIQEDDHSMLNRSSLVWPKISEGSSGLVKEERIR